MGTWLPGVPYTDPTPDQITSEVGTDRTDEASIVAGVEIGDLPAGTPTSASVLPVLVGGNLTQATVAQVLAALRPQASIINLGASVSNTVAETTVLAAGTFGIGANVAAVGDEFDVEAMLLTANLSGGVLTFRPRLKVGGTTVADLTYNVPALAGFQTRIRATIAVEAISPSPIIWVATTIEMSSGSAVGTTFTTVTPAPGLSPATTSAIPVALTTTHSGTAVQTECYRATLRARPRL